MRWHTIVLCGLFLFFSFSLSSQNNRKTEKNIGDSLNLHSPHKASVYSAILPGLGQAYNKKYWKIPIVYAGVGTLTYFALINRNEYQLAKEAFVYVSNEEVYPIDNKYVGRYSANDLITIRDFYRRNTEVSWIFLGLWYVLNIIDATVDAHLFYYDISDELSLQMIPHSNGQPEFGEMLRGTPYMPSKQLLTLKLNF